MEYNDLMILAKQKKILQKDLCQRLDITPAGFKRGIEKGTLPINKVVPLCQILGISPNELLGWEAAPGGNYAAHIGGSNTQNSTEAITALSAQLKEKDRQIDRLLKIVEKGKKQ
jgi:DNA-binding Xre family transcriptional regulator